MGHTYNTSGNLAAGAAVKASMLHPYAVADPQFRVAGPVRGRTYTASSGRLVRDGDVPQVRALRNRSSSAVTATAATAGT
jgi:hypothetical protein